MADENEEGKSGGFFGKTPGGIALNIGCLVIVVVVIAMIALPGHRGFEPRSRQSEAKANLKGIFTAAKSWFAEKDHFPAHSGELGFVPEAGTRYTYFLFPEGRVLAPDERAQAFSGKVAPFATISADTKKHEDAPRFERYGDTGCPLLRAKHKDGTPAALGRSVQGEEEIYTAAAAGNVDRDSGLDCWSISTVERSTSEGRVVAAGEPFDERNDVVK